MYDTAGPMLLARSVVGVLFLLCLGAGLLRRSRQNEVRRIWPEVVGEVIGERSVIGASNRRPVVRFTTRHGETVVAERRTGFAVVTPVIGKRVPVWYDPSDPQHFQVQVLALDRRGSISFVLAGILAALFGILLLP
ncbi:DUF3592 domain-containing protein [Kineosporia rhizophila]|uniref:DUF3592 domain-containing protein n=1 Tax=Kineosporia rhizophila TaxID=84633 RepID=UPI000A8829AE|nr:DUF3592 domain-containing protein [Kineosporia rhizophila]MCE0534314.1 DUF3592 domain-containing protein [Kineosporia rhizophila]